MKLVLYFIAPSPPSRAVLLLLRHLDIEVDVKVVKLDAGEQFEEDFLKLNPAHEVPVLVDGDFTLPESRAILAYLVNSRGPNSNLYPTEPKARAVVDHRLSYDHVLFTRNTILYVSMCIQLRSKLYDMQLFFRDQFCMPDRRKYFLSHETASSRA